ncbi:hypothetical protein JKG47_17090 [Acidithiobacillus sp. MC6.1]|jgi:hypothetical protein|nr:hypothetical protein [Acidithiobacillus sp. MC6.1]
MKKATPATEVTPNNQPINHNTIRALRHMLAGIANLQKITATNEQEQVLIAEIHLALRAEIRRIVGIGVRYG